MADLVDLLFAHYDKVLIFGGTALVVVLAFRAAGVPVSKMLFAQSGPSLGGPVASEWNHHMRQARKLLKNVDYHGALMNLEEARRFAVDPRLERDEAVELQGQTCKLMADVHERLGEVADEIGDRQTSREHYDLAARLREGEISAV